MWKSLVTRRCWEYTIEDVRQLEDVLVWQHPQLVTVLGFPSLVKPIMRVRYADTIPEAYDRLLAKFGETTHLFLEPQHLTTEYVVDAEAVPEDAFSGLLSAVDTLAADPVVREDTKRLLRAADPVEDLQEMRDGFTTGG